MLYQGDWWKFTQKTQKLSLKSFYSWGTNALLSKTYKFWSTKQTLLILVLVLLVCLLVRLDSYPFKDWLVPLHPLPSLVPKNHHILRIQSQHCCTLLPWMSLSSLQHGNPADNPSIYSQTPNSRFSLGLRSLTLNPRGSRQLYTFSRSNAREWGVGRREDQEGDWMPSGVVRKHGEEWLCLGQGYWT